MRASYVAGVVALMFLAACGNEPSEPGTAADDPDRPVATPTAMPTGIPTATGPVTTSGLATVLDDGDGPELCLGGVMESLPPQCGGPKLLGWAWAAQGAHFEEAGGTRWGAFVVTGEFDGKAMTVESVVPEAEYDAPPPQDESVWHTPCQEPEGGWVPVDSTTTTDEALDAAGRVAREVPGFGQLWVDQSINPATGEDLEDVEYEMAMNDPVFTILNVSVTEDLEGAEAAIREVWGGPLCVSEAAMTHDELRRIGRETGDLPGVLSYGGESYPLDVSVIYDDGTIQAWLDAEYGAGTVVVSSALVLAG